MPRSPDSLDDPTPLDSGSLDVARRVGWLLRTTRLHSGSPVPATEFAKRITVPASAVSKWEKGSEDPGEATIAAYERVLGVSPGVLRALVAGLRREFDQPSRRMTARTPRELTTVSERVRAALDEDADGEDWLAFAQTLSRESLALPDFLARPAFDRLVSQTVRAVGGAYLTRMEALAVLRTGPYHQVVREACLALALADDAQVSADVIGVLGVRADGELLRAACGLLTHRDDSVFSGACYALLTMPLSRTEPDPQSLQEVAPVVVAAYAASVGDPERHAALSALIRKLPRGFHKLLVGADLPTLTAPRSATTPATHESAWMLAGSVAVEVMHRLDARPEPLLTRTVFEALSERWSLPAFWSRCTLMALPYRATLAEVVADRCAGAAAEQQSALGHLFGFLGHGILPLARTWLAGDAPERQSCALDAVAHAAEPADRVDTEALRRLIGSPSAGVRRRAQHAAGMSGSPLLAEWVDDPRVDPAIRSGSRWWLAQGRRVDDVEPPTSAPTSSDVGRVEGSTGAVRLSPS